MSRRFINLQTDLLRCFVAVVDFNSFTKAGEELGRTQSAISQQIKRLEELTDGKLIIVKGKSFELTEKGNILIGYARHILQLNDRAISTLYNSEIMGTLKIGLPIDYATEYFQGIIENFSEKYKDVGLEIKCDWSRNILDSLHHDEIDIAVAISDSMPSPYVYLYWSEQPVWICGKSYKVPRSSPVCLIAHPDGCYYRQYMIDMLNAERRDWRIVFESPNVSALQESVLAGMGVSTLSKKTLLKGMRELTQAEGFPKLPHIHIGLFYKNAKMSDAAVALIEKLCQGIHAFRKPIYVQN